MAAASTGIEDNQSFSSTLEVLKLAPLTNLQSGELIPRSGENLEISSGKNQRFHAVFSDYLQLSFFRELWKDSLKFPNNFFEKELFRTINPI